MMASALGWIGTLALLGAVATADDKEPPMDSLGTWRMVAVVVDGKDTPVGQCLMTVTKDGYEVTVDGRSYQKGRVANVVEASPRKSDVVITEGQGAGETRPQITRIEGDVMIGCQAPSGFLRPTEFTSEPGSRRALSVWIRVR